MPLSKLSILLFSVLIPSLIFSNDSSSASNDDKSSLAATSSRMPSFAKNPVKYKNKNIDESDVMNVFVSYGQSWRSQSQPVTGADLIMDESHELAFAPKAKNANALLPAISAPWVAEQYGDFEKLSWENTVAGSLANASGNIGNIAARSFVKSGNVNKYLPFQVVDVGMAYPAYTWQQLQPGTQPWTVMLNAIHKVKTISSAKGKATRWLGVGWTHGIFAPTDSFDYFEQLKEMVAAFDKLKLNDDSGEPQAPLHYFIDMQAGVSDMTVQSPNTLRQLDFATANAARVHLVNPRYRYQIAAGDNVHHTGMGYAQYGEVEGLAKYTTLVEGKNWEPLRIVSGKVAGSKILLTISAPMAGFGSPEIDVAQIERAPQFGFHVKENGVDIPLKSVDFPNPTTIALQLSSSASTASNLEVSYAWYGPGAPFGTHVGVWGNIKRQGPPSVLFRGKTIDLWLCNYVGMIQKS